MQKQISEHLAKLNASLRKVTKLCTTTQSELLALSKKELDIWILYFEQLAANMGDCQHESTATGNMDKQVIHSNIKKTQALYYSVLKDRL